jgi:hypothetical protein
MKSPALRAILLACAVYVVAGVLFGALAGRAATNDGRVAWRLAAWIVSAIAFGAQIAYEQVRLRNAPAVTAFHAALATGLGAFGLAVAANVHAWIATPQRHPLILKLSLAIWPIITALPAFVVALVAAWLLSRIRHGVSSRHPDNHV